MLRIKKEFLNKYVSNQGREFFLSEKLTQQEILFVKRMINSELVEELNESPPSQEEFKGISLNAKKSKRCKGSKELGTNCNKKECSYCKNDSLI